MAPQSSNTLGSGLLDWSTTLGGASSINQVPTNENQTVTEPAFVNHYRQEASTPSRPLSAIQGYVPPLPSAWSTPSILRSQCTPLGHRRAHPYRPKLPSSGCIPDPLYDWSSIASPTPSFSGSHTLVPLARQNQIRYSTYQPGNPHSGPSPLLTAPPVPQSNRPALQTPGTTVPAPWLLSTAQYQTHASPFLPTSNCVPPGPTTPSATPTYATPAAVNHSIPVISPVPQPRQAIPAISATGNYPALTRSWSSWTPPAHAQVVSSGERELEGIEKPVEANIEISRVPGNEHIAPSYVDLTIVPSPISSPFLPASAVTGASVGYAASQAPVASTAAPSATPAVAPAPTNPVARVQSTSVPALSVAQATLTTSLTPTPVMSRPTTAIRAIPTSPAPRFTPHSIKAGTLVMEYTEPDASNLDNELAQAYGLELTDTGFQSYNTLAAKDSQTETAPGKPKAAKSPRQKKTSPVGTKWGGGPGGALKFNAKPEGYVEGTGRLSRWSYSEDGTTSQDVNERLEGDVHFSPAIQYTPEDDAFTSWVCTLTPAGVLRWVRFTAGQPHPQHAGYVFKPAQLPRVVPRWLKETSYKSTQLPAH
ncbi:LOW QUALITY PROTEIN: hypothetical protein RSAG8_10087, partial [Rhizoctonia solani AG-8 WAC10335]